MTRAVAWLVLGGSLPILLGGVLPVERDRPRPAGGAWVYPVGARHDWRTAADSGLAYRQLRGFDTTATATHRGVDLGNGAAGGPVRAAAHGLVLEAVDDSSRTAWGDRIVVAHRLADGSTAYSLYAHLLPGSMRVRAGDAVTAGQPIGRVGRSGNATTPHLHFEVRLTRNPLGRWEKAPAVDPLAFVAAHRRPARPRQIAGEEPPR